MASLNNNSIGNMYAFRPAYTSLFTVETSDATGAPLTSLQAVGVSIPSDTIELERDSVTFKYKVRETGTYRRSSIINITWREDIGYRIWHFHREWLRTIYDPISDQYKAGVNPYKNFTVKAYDENGEVSNTVVLHNVIPQKFGDLNFAWGDEPRVLQYTIPYYVEWIERPSKTDYAAVVAVNHLTKINQERSGDAAYGQVLAKTMSENFTEAELEKIKNDAPVEFQTPEEQEEWKELVEEVIGTVAKDSKYQQQGKLQLALATLDKISRADNLEDWTVINNYISNIKDGNTVLAQNYWENGAEDAVIKHSGGTNDPKEIKLNWGK